MFLLLTLCCVPLSGPLEPGHIESLPRCRSVMDDSKVLVMAQRVFTFLRAPHEIRSLTTSDEELLREVIFSLYTDRILPKLKTIKARLSTILSKLHVATGEKQLLFDLLLEYYESNCLYVVERAPTKDDSSVWLDTR